MVFSSPAFLFYFLPAVLIGYYAIRGNRLHNSWLVVCSVVFYFLGGGYFTSILILSIAINYQLGLWVEKTRGKSHGRLVLGGSILANVAILGYFKYANFFVDQANAVRAAAGLPSMDWVAVALPIGVSFYTFHAMSYVIDIARGESKAKKNPIDYALYVAFFPQLIAGPIVRYQLVERQLTERRETLSAFTEGLYRFCWGLAKKVLIADQVAVVADAAFGAPSGATWTAGTAWIAVIAYTVQIYFDFSAYSDMAIGLARMFGFKFPENFSRPYSAHSVTDFWRRWHMTLSNWFRDYLYIPMGGSHGTKVAAYRNLGVVFVLTGLWHGAAWTFVIWGVYHGALLMLERATGLRDLGDDRMVVLRRAVTLLCVMIGWAFFRSDDLAEASAIIQAMFSAEFAIDPQVFSTLSHQTVAAMSIGAFTFLLPRTLIVGRILEHAEHHQFRPILRLVTLAVLFPSTLAYAMLQDFSPFLYYQF